MADENNEIYQGQVYYNQVNIGLYNDIVAFVAATTAADTMQVLRNLEARHLWYSASHSNNIQEQYGFRYFGELLERFEDKAGSDIRDMRAIALAMADTKDLFTDDMFVGNQKNNFIKKITRLSVGDIYLKGALYLLKKDGSKASGLLEVLARTTYSQTEELLFVMYLYDDFEQAFLNFKQNLIHLLSKANTMSPFGNMDIYCRLIRQLYRCHKIKQIRTKDMAIIRALMEFPLSFIKKGGRHHGILLNNGFTAEEIIYMNSFIISKNIISAAMDLHSIVAEKVAVEMCITFINSEDTYSPCVYEHLEWLLKIYREFHIKISGNKGIYQAIENEIELKNPGTFLWLYKIIKPKDVFRFDILEEKWDILSCELKADVYRKLFDKQISAHPELNREQIIERIKKYETLTGLSYQALFEHEFTYDSSCIFDFLVKKGIVNLKNSFASCTEIDLITEEIKDGSKPPMLKHIGSCIKGIHNRESFDFFKYFFSKYTFEDMHRLFIDGNKDSYFFDVFYKGLPRYHGDSEKHGIAIERQFLSEDEHRELFGWLDDYIFQYKVDKYSEFAVLLLDDSFIKTLFPHNELREIYDTVCAGNIGILDQYRYRLKKSYLSEAELQAERDAEDARKKEQAQQWKEQELKKLKEELIERYDGTFGSLLSYVQKNNSRFAYHDDAVKYLNMALSNKNYALEGKEIGRFLIYSGKMLNKGLVSFDTIKNHVSLVKEVTPHDENTTAVERDTDD